MPHKDRAARLDYLRRWKERNRPSPAQEPQADPALPPLGVVVFSDDGTKVQCHACGRWFRALNTHMRLHDLDAKGYKEMYGLPRTISMWPPSTKAKQRQAALDRDQGSIGRQHIPPSKGRPVGQDARLGVRINASSQRKGINMRSGGRTRK